MRPAHVVEIVTPKKFVLNGLWFGPKKPKRVYIVVHGLTSGAFSRGGLADQLVDTRSAVLTFGNRGHDIATYVSNINKSKSILAGAAFERFEDCTDDVQGAVDLARASKAKEVILVGHSTGCQKSIYWAAKGGRGVKGIILLAPLSDYACGVAAHGAAKLRLIAAQSRAMLKSGRGNELLNIRGWKSEPNSPARFQSLYTPDSVEQSIFPYFDEKRIPKLLRTVRQPILALFAGKDEHSATPASTIAAWFEKNSGANLETAVVADVMHGFKGRELDVAKGIRQWATLHI